MKAARTPASGTLVRSNDGIIGTVERIIHRSGKGGDAALVVAADGQTRYRIPLASLSTSQNSDGRQIAQLAVGGAALTRYQVAVAPEPTVADDAMLRLPLAEEELVADTRPIQRGVVHLHKSVEEQTQQLVVPVTTETAAVERIPAAQFDATQDADPDVLFIPLTEERLVVHKETVIIEYLVVRKQQTVQQETVSETLRREVLTITPDAIRDDEVPLVQLEGEFETVEHP